MIGTELRAQGYNMSLGGGVNLTREPRNGRTFEYMGEDPLLGGTLDGNVMPGEQAQHVIGDVKHYAINDQESGRYAVNANIDERSMRESDLLAFEIALKISKAAAVMCKVAEVHIDPKMLQVFDEKTDTWKSVPGSYTLSVGASSRDLPLHEVIKLF